MIRVSNAIVTLTPATLPINTVAVSFPTYNPIFYYTHDYPGGLSALMYLLAALWFVKTILRKTKDTVILSFFILPLVINLVLYGWKEWGLVNQILHPTVPLLIMVGIKELNNFYSRFRSILLSLVFAGALIEDVLFANIIKRFYLVEGGINSVIEAGRQFITDFDINNFVSALFFMRNEFIENVIISITLIMIFTIYLLRSNQKIWIGQ